MRGFSRGRLDPGLKVRLQGGESPRPGGRGQWGGHADDGGEDEEEEEHCLQRAPHHLQGLLLTVSFPEGIYIRPRVGRLYLDTPPP